jgi:heme exporter protein D
MDDRNKELRALLDEYARLTGQNSGNAQTFNVNMGGHGITIAWCAAIISLVLVVVITINSGNEHARLQANINAEAEKAQAERAELRSQASDFKDYISAIYQVAPELQKKLQERAQKDDQTRRE